MNAELAALEKLMQAHLDEHQQLLACMNRKRQAIAEAEIETVTQLVQQERLIVRRVRDIERHRVALVRKITRQMQGQAQEPLTMSEIAAEVADEALRARLLALTEQLRQVTVQVRERSSVIRSAAEALSQHMAGVMQTVQSALSRAGVYGSHGRVAVGTQLDSSLDIKS